MYKILIIEDHALIRDGMRLLLEGLDSSVTVFEGSSCEEGLNQLPGIEPLDLILLDLGLPGVNGIEGIPLFRSRLPTTPIVILSASEKGKDARDALDAGAQGFISKSANGVMMLNAIRLVLAGGTYIPPNVVLGEAEPGVPSKPVQLTPRQLEVLTLLVQGKPNKVIGRALNMAESTVRVHTTAIFKALEVTNRTEAAFTATQLGLISDQVKPDEANG